MRGTLCAGVTGDILVGTVRVSVTEFPVGTVIVCIRITLCDVECVGGWGQGLRICDYVAVTVI